MNCGSGPENCHETALELVSGVNFGRGLHHFSSPTRWNGSRGQVRPETGQKPNPNYNCYLSTKPYEFIGFGGMDVTKPYKFIGFGAMDATKPY